MNPIRNHPRQQTNAGSNPRTEIGYVRTFSHDDRGYRQSANTNRGIHSRDDRSVRSGHTGNTYRPNQIYGGAVDGEDQNSLQTKRSNASRLNNVRGFPADDRSIQSKRNYNERNTNHPYGHHADHSDISNPNRAQNSKKTTGEYNHGNSDMDDTKSSKSHLDFFPVSSSDSMSKGSHPVSNERIALSMAIQHHSHKLLETDVDINEIWDIDDPLGDFDAAMFTARRRDTTSIRMIEPTEETLKDKVFALCACCTPLKANKKYFLPAGSKRIRIFLFLVAGALSSLTAFYFQNGSFGLYAAKFLSNEFVFEEDEQEKLENIVEKQEEEIIEPVEPPPQPLPEPNIPTMLPQNVDLSPLVDLNLADTNERITKKDTPYFWLIPRSGANAVKTVMSQCFKMVEASEMGAGYDNEETLKIYVAPERGDKFVNVDMNSAEGIARAKRLKLIESGIADVIISPIFHDAIEIFSPTHTGKAFALFRHPMDTALSIYRSNQMSATISIEEFFEDGSLVDDNWMTRRLANKISGSITENDMKRAIETIRRKFVVGLVDQARESVRRFTIYFGWTSNELSQSLVNQCMTQVTQMKRSRDKVEEGSTLWNLILRHNQYDLALFLYVQGLFIEQGNTLFSPEK